MSLGAVAVERRRLQLPQRRQLAAVAVGKTFAEGTEGSRARGETPYQDL